MNKYPEEFRHILAMIALQPAAPRRFVEAALGRAGIADGRESFDKALHRRSGYRLDDFRPIEDATVVTVPTLVVQVHDDVTMPPSYVQKIYDTISATDKKLFWIEGTDLRFQGLQLLRRTPGADPGVVRLAHAMTAQDYRDHPSRLPQRTVRRR